nr:MAG TPA: hypothetical protein [Caudoviricetes sp.]
MEKLISQPLVRPEPLRKRKTTKQRRIRLSRRNRHRWNQLLLMTVRHHNRRLQLQMSHLTRNLYPVTVE